MSEAINFPHLGIYLDHVGKSFSVFGIEIAYYGVTIAVAMLAGIFLALHVAKITGQNPDDYFDMAIAGIIVSVICARLYYVIFSWDQYKDDLLSILNTRGGGLAIYGGVIGAILTMVYFNRKKKIPFGLLGDTASCGIVLGQIIGRWGNFFNEEAHGGPTDLPWAQIIDGIGYHPTFLYESIWCFCLFWFLLWFDDHKRSFDGQMISLYMMLYSVERFFVEGLRTDSLMVGPFRQAQLLSLGLIAAGIALYVFFKKRTGRYLP